LVAWQLNNKVRLRKNRFYWDAANTRSELVDMLPTASPNTALNLYETGVADVVWDGTGGRVNGCADEAADFLNFSFQELLQV
jgi:ABC-type oligopeptide transport system substrate-binding subunit